MLASMATSERRPSANGAVSPGAAIAARRHALRLTSEDVQALTGGVINPKMLSRLENDHVSPNSLRVSKLTALLSALRWTVAELEEATGVRLDQGLPGTETYSATLRLPVLGSVSAGMRDTDAAMAEPSDYMTVDPHDSGLRGRPADKLVVLVANGDSMVSEQAARQIPHGAKLIVELGAAPRDGDIVVAWMAEREIAVVKQYREQDAVLRSYNPKGPVFRVDDDDIDIRGVVRLVQFRPN